MKFMVTYPLTRRGYKERITRFLETGAPPPEEVAMLGRWFTVSHNRGFMLAETDDPKALFRWVSQWADLVDFEIDPVIEDEDAAPILKDLM